MDLTLPSAVSLPPASSRTERRLQAKVDADERIVAWSRGWISRDGRMHTVFAARTPDFVVLTDQQLHLFSTGFFTRLPRRRVFITILDRLTVTTRKPHDVRHLRLATEGRRALLLDLRRGERGEALAAALLARNPEGGPS
jgi:hypothetical protein